MVAHHCAVIKRTTIFVRTWYTRYVLLALFVGLLMGCSPDGEDGRPLLVGAAISLRPVLDSAVASYASQHDDLRITVSYAGSGTIRRQLEFGAPIDVFLSAATDHIDSLEARGLVLPGSRTPFASNTLVMIMSIQHAPITDIPDLRLGSISRVAIGQPDIVPAGRYAYQTLEGLGMRAEIQDKLVFAKDVQQVLIYVRTGSVDVGFVYGSDVLASTPVRAIRTIPDSLHAPILYEGIVRAGSVNTGAASAFLAYLASDSLKSLFTTYGFRAPPK